MHDLLIESAKEAIREDARKQGLSVPGKVLEADETAAVELVAGLSRAEAEARFLRFQPTLNKVGGSDGIRLAVQAGRLVAEPRMVHALGKWTQAVSGNARILWIISPWETGTQSSARKAALGVISTAIQAKAQVISFVCKRPLCGQKANKRICSYANFISPLSIV
ncbi:hypothetical protein BDV19DRAFT_22908 [Aspergillus venezuelensis]